MPKLILQGQDQRVGEWVCERAGGTWTPGDVGIGLVDGPDGDLLAGVLFNGYNGASIQMHVAAVPGQRWMTREYLGWSFAYPFLQLKVRKIIGLVGESNMEARRFDEHLGFRLEATLKDAHPSGDLLVYSMTPEQCRWIHRIRLKGDSLYGQTVSTPGTGLCGSSEGTGRSK